MTVRARKTPPEREGTYYSMFEKGCIWSGWFLPSLKDEINSVDASTLFEGTCWFFFEGFEENRSKSSSILSITIMGGITFERGCSTGKESSVSSLMGEIMGTRPGLLSGLSFVLLPESSSSVEDLLRLRLNIILIKPLDAIGPPPGVSSKEIKLPGLDKVLCGLPDCERFLPK